MKFPKVIWTCWFQGIDNAPPIVRRCIRSWSLRNPSWELRCLDASAVAQTTDLAERFDISKKEITAASMSDLVRLLLLETYGGVWVDATVLCNKPLDSWLEDHSGSGFFAFENEAPDRPIASWFLASEPHHRLTSAWVEHAAEFWKSRSRTDDYFWMHHLYPSAIATSRTDPHANRGPVSAAPSHSFSAKGAMFEDLDTVGNRVAWQAPMFKLSHRTNHYEAHNNSLYSLLSRPGTVDASLGWRPPLTSVQQGQVGEPIAFADPALLPPPTPPHLR